VVIGQSVLRRYRDISAFNMTAVRHLDALDAFSDHSERAFGGLYRRAKFVLNRCTTVVSITLKF